MWRHYFGPGLEYHGVDINWVCRKFGTEDNVAEIIIGDQGSESFWDSVVDRLPQFDIILDDGGHTMVQQITTMRRLFPKKIAEGGVYMVEDLHTSAWHSFGGGLRKDNTFLQFSKNLIDELMWQHAMAPKWASPSDLHYATERAQASQFYRHIKSMHFSNGIVVLEHGDVTAGNINERRGTEWIPYHPPDQPAPAISSTRSLIGPPRRHRNGHEP